MNRLAPCLVALALCLTGVRGVAKPPAEPPGELLVSIEMVEGWKPIERRTGWWFLAEKTTGNLIGPRITGYEYRDGKLVDEFGGGLEPDLFHAIADVGIEQFDFEAEAERAASKLAAEAAGQGDALIVTGPRDGARFIVTIVTRGGTVRLDAWNPGMKADSLAAACEKIARVKRVFDLLRDFYADSKLQF